MLIPRITRKMARPYATRKSALDQAINEAREVVIFSVAAHASRFDLRYFLKKKNHGYARLRQLRIEKIKLTRGKK